MCIFYKYFYSFWYPYFLWYFHTFLVLPLPDVSTLVWVFPLPDVPTRSWYFHSCLVFLHLLGVPTARCSYCLVFSLLDVPTAFCFDALFPLPVVSTPCSHCLIFLSNARCFHAGQGVSTPALPGCLNAFPRLVFQRLAYLGVRSVIWHQMPGFHLTITWHVLVSPMFMLQGN